MKTSDMIIIVLLVSNVFILGYFFIFRFNTDGKQCIDDPLVYGYNKLQEVNQYDLQCSCSLLSPNPSPILHFNSEGRYIERVFLSSEADSGIINWSFEP